MKIFFSIILILISLNIFSNDLKISNAKIRLVPPSSSVTALFMNIENTTRKDLKITSIEADISDSVEMHSMIMDNTGMQMRPVSAIEIKAKSTTELKRGGLHVMFINLKKPLKDGENHKIKINLSNKKNQTIEVKVQPID